MSDVTLLYGTHVNGRLDGDGPGETPARYFDLVDRLGRARDDALFVGSGDDLAPSVPSTVFRGRQAVDVLNAAGLDCNVYGNHDFDFGPERLVELVAESEFPWLAANVVDERTGDVLGRSAGARRYALFDADGVTVGVTGVADDDTAATSSPGEHTRVRPSADALAAVTPELRDAGADVVVALTQLMDDEPDRFARRVPVDVLLGFNHDLDPPRWVDGTLVACAGDRYESVSELGLSVGNDGVTDYEYALHEVGDAAVGTCERVREVVERYERRLDEELDAVLGRTTVPLDARFETIRRRESNLCNFVVDAMRDAADADAALLPAGGVRTDTVHPAGDLRRATVVEMLPFRNRLTVLAVDGAALRTALENGVSMVEDFDGRFPQVSGVEYRYDPDAPVGDRVVAASVDGDPVRDDRTYTVATSDFAADGGNGYEPLAAAPAVGDGPGPLVSTLVADRVRDRGTIAPETDGRIAVADRG
jgi:2',3'-cyclic-nucleotide 2'-phosphodiesterase (5'-nucleotidase family)